MTSYKRPVFFDRDIKSFSELSNAVEQDLGLVARSILADAYINVGTTDSGGVINVKDGADATRVSLNSYGVLEAFDETGNPVLVADGYARAFWTGGQGVDGNISAKKADGGTYAAFTQQGRLGAAGILAGGPETGTGAQLATTGVLSLFNASSHPIVEANAAGNIRVIHDVGWDDNGSLKGAELSVSGNPQNMYGRLALSTVRDGNETNDKLVDIYSHQFISNSPENSYRKGALKLFGTSLDLSNPRAEIYAFGGGGSDKPEFRLGYDVDNDENSVKLSPGESYFGPAMGTPAYNDGARVTIEFASTADVSGKYGYIKGLSSTPVEAHWAASKGYVDAVAQGLDVKASCKVATTENITLSGLQTVGGDILVAGDRCLVKNQTNATENGIYVVSADAWTRALDMDADAEFPGAFTFIEAGDYQGTGWVCTNPFVTLGTTNITFTQFSGAGAYTAGTGISFAGTVINAVVDGVHAIINGSNQIDVAGLPLQFTIDAVATSANVTAANLNTLVDGAAGDAKALHSHSADAEYLTAVSGLAAGQAAIIDASGAAATAGTTSAGAYMVGVVESIADGSARIVRGGIAVGVLSGATAGDAYYVQADGTLGTSLPASGRCVMAGIARSATDLHVQIRDFGAILAA